MEVAYFAAGCFWGVEETFRQVKGVLKTSVGYMGGQTTNPNYEEVCGGQSGHAETVKVRYDPQAVSYAELLETFWVCHDPTQLNRQGPDVGSQYRSVIFYTTEEQREAAIKSRDDLDNSKVYENPVKTQIEPAPQYFKAEGYHQQYIARKRGDFY